MQNQQLRDHGGNLDAAMALFGGALSEWIDLSTGINPFPYPHLGLPDTVWTALPDRNAQQRLEVAARDFWNVPEDAAILAVPGASAAIARIPHLAQTSQVLIPAPTYNEHAASFRAAGWQVSQSAEGSTATVLVNPNNPDGRHWRPGDLKGDLHIIDESFCDISPSASLIAQSSVPGTLILKSFGKFWGLAGLRLGFVIGDPALIDKLSEMMGPWPVSGPALHIGAQALEDPVWAQETRKRLTSDALRLDRLATGKGAKVVGGSSLFRLFEVEDASAWQEALARHKVWSRIFPYNAKWLRLGLPAPDRWDQVRQALS